MTATVLLPVTAAGLLIGSFLNVVIARVPAGESVVRPPSHCPRCDAELSWVDNIPLVSWLVLRARCRHCSAPISARYPLVEAGTAIAFAVVALVLGPRADLVAHLVAAAGMIALSAVDLDCKRLPDRILGPTVVATAVSLAVAVAVDDRWGDGARALIGAAIGFAALGAVHYLRPAAMGFGDVKLAALCGLLLGWHGLADVVLGLYGAFVLGAAAGIVLIAVGRATSRKAAIPFGPFLAAGTMLQILALQPLADVARGLF